MCANRTDWGPWPAVRGRCVKYRKEQQSCRPFFGNPTQGVTRSGAQYVVDPDTGRPPVRPMVCGPGLVCTGETEPTPYTCVKARPADVCYTVRRAFSMRPIL